MISYKTRRIFACGLTVQEEQLMAHVLRKWAYLFTALHRKDFLFRISSDKIIIPSSKTISRYFPLLYIVIVIITLSGCGPTDRVPLVEYIILFCYLHFKLSKQNVIYDRICRSNLYLRINTDKLTFT